MLKSDSKVIVIKRANDNDWYRNLIGKRFSIVHVDEESNACVYYGCEFRKIKKEDCSLVK